MELLVYEILLSVLSVKWMLIRPTKCIVVVDMVACMRVPHASLALGQTKICSMGLDKILITTCILSD